MKIRLQGQPVDPVAGTSGEIVTREELQRNCRGTAEELQRNCKRNSGRADTFVDFEQGLNNAMKRLRAALDD